MQLLEAYVDSKDTILIVNNKESSFKINGTFLASTLVDKKADICYYIANFPIELGNYYIIEDDYGNKCYLEIRYYVKEDDFDKNYYYDKDDLGPIYSKEKTTFKLWSPLAQKVFLNISIDNKDLKLEMERLDKGVFAITIDKDLDGCLYTYSIFINDKETEVIDPYCYSLNSNSKKSAVINLNKINEKDDYKLPTFNQINDAIIYEISVRDFSMDGSMGKDLKGKFLSFCKEGLKTKNGNPIGIDYIKDLGVTHIQLMPILDFYTVNEDNIEEKYNWGYDPYCFNALDGSFSTNPNDPYSRVLEAKQMIFSIHKNGLRVTLDVVFNHTYLSSNSIYNSIVPRYYYLMDRNGNYSNGSFCGNDFDTTRLMVKKYFVDMSARLVKLYNVDGLRMDLMGILTIDLVNEINKKCKAINPSFILYGEGWNMPSMLPEYKRASLGNFNKLPNVAFFNDYFRDTTSGKIINEFCNEKGYLNGNVSLATNFVHAMEGTIAKGLYFQNPLSSINYVECHDNATLYDKLRLINFNVSEQERNRIQLCSIASILFAQGIPFLHAGMEINRTKFGNMNSYNAPDDINKFVWDNVDKYKDNYKAVKDFISIRKQFSCFRMTNKSKIYNSIDYRIENGVVMFLYAYNGELVVLLFNPTGNKQMVHLRSEYNLFANQNGYVKNDDRVFKEFKIMPYSFMMLTK